MVFVMKKHIFLANILILILILSHTTSCKKQNKYSDPAGIYLESLGNGYIEIGRNNWGQLYLKDTNLFESTFEYKEDWKISHIRKKLTIEGNISYNNRPLLEVSYELQPSSTVPGDWDLVDYALDSVYKVQTTRSRNRSQSLQSLLNQPLTSTETNEAPFSSIKQTVASYLHRIDDGSLIEYFKLISPLNKRHGSETNARLIEIATNLLNAHPNDEYLKMLYLDAVIRNRDIEELGKQVKEWKEEYSKRRDFFSQFMLSCAERSLKSYQLTDSGKNAHNFIEKVMAKNTNLATRIKRFPDILNYDESTLPKCPINKPMLSLLDFRFLDVQTTAKVLCVESIFLMLQGKGEEALRLLASVYHLGKLMDGSNNLISHLIGIAVRSIATYRLKTYALNCCETEEDFQNLWKTLETLNYGLQVPDVAKIYYEGSPFSYHITTRHLSNTLDFLTRHRCAEAKFQLLRMATEAKYSYIFEGKFPEKPEDFNRLLKGGIPKDSFSLYPLRFIPNQDTFICYSIGPDNQDNQATIEYDPTNGTISDGDIFTKIPRQREFPFPRNGLRASTKDEVLKQFPNGLPVDPFGNRKSVPLLISNSTPVYIFSAGPDFDGIEIQRQIDSYIPTVYYDPTNGTISYGDLFIEIPE